ncbi:MAG: Tex family protein, partial [Enterococcus raffinosus]|nr:Tex family protein [Enterococcus raffinosus]
MAEGLNQDIIQLLNKELTEYRPQQIKVVLNLLTEGNTVPFIARYRKEMTGTLDEVQIREIEERYNYLENLEKRKQEVLRLIDEQGKLTAELAQKIQQSAKVQKVEDLYRPYKQKRRTKATIAKENGLEPLADYLMSFPQSGDVYAKAEEFISEAVTTPEEALQGAHEIVAEQISDNPDFRTWIRTFTKNKGVYQSKVKDAEKDEKDVYEMYYDFAEPINKMVSHRVLASNRGEKEEILKVSIVVEEEKIFDYLERHLVTNNRSITVEFIREAYKDSYKRFIGPAIEREIRNELTEDADEQAINIFGENLRNLLLQPPLKGKVVLGFDPAYRTGCKLAVVDETGKVLAIEVIYPHKPAPQAKRQAAGPAFQTLIKKHNVEMVAIGNGTASRESELFVAEQLKQIHQQVFYVIVNEAGASVYSASDIARNEFPDLQVEERSAVSIARRLQDPLSELVKIDPKAVGVGQYQHDLNKKRLTEVLDGVVEDSVNSVGVDLNTASYSLLEHVSGISKSVAKNIVLYREENGAFTSRAQLKKVKRLGPSAFVQCAGYMRIADGKNPLDNTGVHPESYDVCKKMIEMLGYTIKDIEDKNIADIDDRVKKIGLKEISKQLEIGEPTLRDIILEIKKPGRD